MVDSLILATERLSPTITYRSLSITTCALSQ